MDFDLTWILLGFPVAFALGWLASRLDVRQLRIENRQAPKAYFKGLNFLLNEQQDQAIDAFIEAVQNDPDTSELHFALGNLFRRRGEYERAVRVHQHLLSRGDLSADDGHRAQHALALDYLKAGLLDRAEEALLKLEGTRFEAQARLALLANYERSRDWEPAALVAQKLENAGQGSFKGRLAHYLCEQANALTLAPDRAQALLKQAMATAPDAARPRIELAELQHQQGNTSQAIATLKEAVDAAPAAVALIAPRLASICDGRQTRRKRAGAAESRVSTHPFPGRAGCHRGPGSCQRRHHQQRARLVCTPSGARAIPGGCRQMDRWRKAGARTVSPPGATRTGPCREAPDPLPLCRLRL